MSAPAGNQPLKVVLVDTRNPLNIGAVARAMSNLGFFELRLVHPYDVAFREAASAVGASELMRTAEVFPALEEALADCSLVVGATGLGHRQMKHPLHRLERAGRLLRRHLQSGNAALVFGSEKYGLSNTDASYCHWLLHIPTRAEHDSMNLAQAVAVCLYELVRQPSSARHLPEAARLAEGEELERFTQVLQDALEISGYADFERTSNGRDKIRRLVRHLQMRAADAPLWTGMLRQILWKLKHPKG